MDAALAYADAGWYVLPTNPADIKNPGSVVKGKWHEKSSRDPDQIRQWWETNPACGIALHCGRSNAGVFDYDQDDLQALRAIGRSDLAEALLAATALQGTRRDGDRGHYIFLLPDDGREYGNSAGAFMAVGEFRGKNGVIIAAPTPHPDADTKGGQYRQIKTGPVGAMPEVLRECLTEAGESADPLTDAAMEAFLDTYTGGGCGREDCRHSVAGPVKQLRQRVANGESRHDSLVRIAPWAFAEAMAGCYSARELFGTLYSAYSEEFSDHDGRGRTSRLGDEYLRIVQWAMAAAQAEPERAHRNDYGPTDDELALFWSARPELARLHQFARARCVGPWSTLGAVLARVVATIPPYVVLPPTVGSVASVNLFVALVAPSGFGKGASEAVAEDFLVTATHPWVAAVGSGEGLLKQYAYKKKTEQINLRDTAIFTVPEVDTFAALSGRGGSTLIPELRKAWMGERLGFGWADVEKAVTVMAHRYRMTMVVGVQPGRGGVLLDDADGGTPQRFLWLPTTDSDAPNEPPQEPERLQIPAWPNSVEGPTGLDFSDGDGDTGGLQVKFGPIDDAYRLEEPADHAAFHVLGLPPNVVDAIRAEHLVKRRGEVPSSGALDSHAMLARLKIAVGLMWLNGRTDKVSDEDWALAGTVLSVSNATRATVLAALSSNATKGCQGSGTAGR
ncbi:bifunctional DNA primase/polymerase [Mycolicibacterium neoaurum]|uniref:bifunctional DNA primase/polymerase n=1 Tax=Mycolicibacterium neoaurum TaxID=1795 RepID=UPI002673A62E|nr:bifunctional DNA primase/polymerase [Mycolicibacterium neoaurum]MDO3398679.1 bifunctional DNA primase/polymerase [Mycolicibacterium neoaurum]